MLEYLGSPIYMAILFGSSALLLGLFALVFKDSLRVSGMDSWAILLIFGGLGGFAAMPLGVLMGLQSYIVPLAAFGIIVSIPVLHWVIPAAAPDIHISSFGTTVVLAVCVGVAVAAAGLGSGEVKDILPASAVETEEFPGE